MLTITLTNSKGNFVIPKEDFIRIDSPRVIKQALYHGAGEYAIVKDIWVPVILAVNATIEILELLEMQGFNQREGDNPLFRLEYAGNILEDCSVGFITLKDDIAYVEIHYANATL